jgi:hypothetical protein
MSRYTVRVTARAVLVKTFDVHAHDSETAMQIAEGLAQRDLDDGESGGWDMTLDNEVIVKETEVVE